MAYAPNLSTQAALNRLALWINKNKKLSEALRESGYSKMQRVFTPLQVALIFEYLGEP